MKLIKSIVLEDIVNSYRKIENNLIKTPTHIWESFLTPKKPSNNAEVVLKLELFQHTGTFKARGALLNVSSLTHDALERGVTAVSAGNHAIATAFAAQSMGSNAKVVMIKTANPFRMKQCEAYGADIVLADNIHEAFAIVEEIKDREKRFFIHPYESLITVLGSATLGLEFALEAPELDAVIIPIGGGGLCAGVSSAFKLIQPNCVIYGVEPIGADTMFRSFKEGSPQKIDKVRTIADSLGAPFSLPYSYEICRRNVDDIVLVSDTEISQSMGALFSKMKLAVEPAGAAATAAFYGPLYERLENKRVGIIVCGANIDIKTFSNQAIF